MKPKIPAQRIDSGECTISVGQVVEDGEIIEPGIEYHVHEGEWVEMLPVLTVREVMNLSSMQKGEGGALGANLEELCDELSKRLIDWNWTDIMGEDLPKPYKNPEVLGRLTSEELLWLVNAANNSSEAEEDRKKDLEQLETIS